MNSCKGKMSIMPNKIYFVAIAEISWKSQPRHVSRINPRRKKIKTKEKKKHMELGLPPKIHKVWRLTFITLLVGLKSLFQLNCNV